MCIPCIFVCFSFCVIENSVIFYSEVIFISEIWQQILCRLWQDTFIPDKFAGIFFYLFVFPFPIRISLVKVLWRPGVFHRNLISFRYCLCCAAVYIAHQYSLSTLQYNVIYNVIFLFSNHHIIVFISESQI